MTRSQLARDVFKAFLTLAALAALIGLYWLWLLFRCDRPYHRIAREDPEAHVVMLLGKPYEISTPNDTLKETWSDDESFGIAQRQIAKQYRYRVPIISGDEFIIGFDSDGHAVTKQHLTSP